ALLLIAVLGGGGFFLARQTQGASGPTASVPHEPPVARARQPATAEIPPIVPESLEPQAPTAAATGSAVSSGTPAAVPVPVRATGPANLASKTQKNSESAGHTETPSKSRG